MTDNSTPILEYNAEFTPAKFHKSKARVRGIKGPIGSGKSVACCIEIFLKASTQHPSKNGKRQTRFAVIRNTVPELETTTIATWLDWFPEKQFGRLNRKPPITHYIRINDIELDVIFLALDRPDDVKKLLSLEVTGIFINEARNIHKDIVDQATGRIGRYPPRKQKPQGFQGEWPTWRGVIMDTNPPDDDHWWYNLAEVDTPPIFEFFDQPSGLSPKAENLTNLPTGYYQDLIHGKTQEWINVYVHGEYGTIKDGKPVYNSSYNDKIHCVKEGITPNPKIPLDIGIDYGNTPCAIITQTSLTGSRLVLEEIITQDTAIQDFAKILIQKLNRDYKDFLYTCYGDPAGEFKDQQQKTAQDLMKAQGVFVKSAPSNSVDMRIESVVYELNRMVNGSPAFIIDAKKCPVLRKGFNGGYKYKRLNVSGGDKYEDKPEKNRFSHIHDATQYVCLSTGSYKAITQAKNRSNTKTVIAKNKWSIWKK